MADGSRLVAVQRKDSNGQPGSLWLSVDYGYSWSPLSGAPYGYWSAISSSNDGATLFAVQDMDESGLPGSVFVSVDFGMTWKVDPLLPQAHWAGVSVSADGSHFVATPGGNSTGGMYIGSFQVDPPIGIMVTAAAAAGVSLGVTVGKYVRISDVV